MLTSRCLLVRGDHQLADMIYFLRYGSYIYKSGDSRGMVDDGQKSMFGSV